MCLLSSQAKKPITQVRVIGWLLPAVESAVTARDKTLLHTENVLHTAVRASANKAGCENNTEDEGHGLDGRNEDASHDVSFQTEGFQYTPRFSRGSLRSQHQDDEEC